MIGYVVAGYSLVFGTLGLYAFRTIVRSREVAARLLAAEEQAAGAAAAAVPPAVAPSGAAASPSERP